MKRWSIHLFRVLGIRLGLFRVLGIRLELHVTFLLLVVWYLVMGFQDGGMDAVGIRSVSLGDLKWF